MAIKQKLIRLTKNLEGKFNWKLEEILIGKLNLKLEDCITFLIVVIK